MATDTTAKHDRADCETDAPEFFATLTGTPQRGPQPSAAAAVLESEHALRHTIRTLESSNRAYQAENDQLRRRLNRTKNALDALCDSIVNGPT